MATSIGPRIKVDGEAEYRAELNRIIQQTKTLDSEMKKITASFNSTTSAEEKAAAKTEVLTKQVENQREKVRMLKDMAQQAAQVTGGQSTTSALKWKQALFEAEAQLSQLENELVDNTAALNNEQNAENAAAANVDKFAAATQKSSTALSAKAVIIGNIITSLAKQGAQLLKIGRASCRERV